MNSRAILMFLCWITLAATATAANGCRSSSDDDAGSCGKVAACGGDLKGTWKLTSACYVASEQPSLSCPSATEAVFVDDASGRITFAKDTFMRALDLNGRTVITYPATCKKSSGQNRTCKDFEGTLFGEQTTCTTAANGDCLCTSPIHTSWGDSGAYSVDGTQLTTLTDTFDYCAQGNTLMIRPQATAALGGATMLLESTLEKQ